MTTLEQFLANQQSNTVTQLKNTIESENNVNYDFLGDKRWKPVFPNNSGAVDYIIRFLPSKSGNPDESYKSVYKHSFQGDANQFLIDNCPTTIGNPCPVCESNKVLWNIDQDKTRKRSRKNTFYTNILVVQDSMNPENNGKVFVYEMPKAVKAFIDNAVNPQFASDKPFDPFNIFHGANFHMKAVKNVYWKYERSSFLQPTSVFDHTTMKPEELLEQLYDIASITNNMPFKSYDDLKSRLDLVDGLVTVPTATTTQPSMNPNIVKPNDISTNYFDSIPATQPEVLQPVPTPVVETKEVIQDEISEFLADREFPDF